jgi:uncharacterized protein YbjT (DUF2867 family)
MRGIVLTIVVLLGALADARAADPAAGSSPATAPPPAAMPAAASRHIVVIGATARSSTEIIWQALAQGYRVTAIARDPTRVELRNERLRVVAGDVYDRASIEAALDGDEVVISMIGPRVDPMQEVQSMDLFTRGTANIIEAMKRKGNRRLLVASSLGVEATYPTERPAPGNLAAMWLWNSRRLYADMQAMEEIVRRSGLDYVILRPAFMVEEAARQDLRVAVEAPSPKGRMITYADFGAFVLDQVPAASRYLGKTVGLYSERELAWGKTADFAKLAATMKAPGNAAVPATASSGATAAPGAPGPAQMPLRATPRGDPSRGRDLAGTCTPCHGESGVSPSPAFPIIAGQQYDYLVAAMLGYLSGTRQDSIMGGSIRTLARNDIENVAAWFASLGRAGQGVLAGSGAAPASPASAASSAMSAPVTAPVAAPTSAAASSPALAAALAAAEAARALPLPAPPQDSRTRTRGLRLEQQACARQDAAPAGQDRDADGLPDRDDGAPEDPGEFARDADGNGLLGLCTARQMQAIAQRGDAALARGYELARDVDAGDIADFAPLGNCGPANNCMISRDRYGFAGRFDGNGHAVRNLRVIRPDAGGVGLFGTLARSGSVQHLRIVDGQVQGANGTGLLVGANFGVISDCSVQGKVDGRVAIGGVAGGNAGRIVRCTADVELTAVAAAGGLVGDMNGIVSDSSAQVRLRAGKGVGGLVGLSTYGTIENCATAGSIEGADNVGGIVGLNTDARLSSSYSLASISASGTNAGGAVGFSSHSLVQHVYARGTVSGTSTVGGLVGRNNGALLFAYAAGRVSARDGLGGLIGDNTGGTVQAAYWDADLAATKSGAGAPRSSVELKSLTAASARFDAADMACARTGAGATPAVARGTPVATLWQFGPGDTYPTLGCAPKLRSSP